MEQHIEGMQDSKEDFQCKQCRKYVLFNQEISRHSTVHSGVKGFICSSCEKSNTGKGIEPRSEKTGLRGFRPGPTQTGLRNH